MESCGHITIKDNNIKLVIDTSGHGGNYSWSIFRLETLLMVSYFAKISVARFNKYQRNMYYIDLVYTREIKINSSSQFEYKNTCNYKELKRLLKEKVIKWNPFYDWILNYWLITAKKKNSVMILHFQKIWYWHQRKIVIKLLIL